ncbi:MAG TPA: protein kinase [Gemmatimonadales bacterium]|nr:protein kinase [Gemmatimonadales bacterium]
MSELEARLQSALGDAYRIERELGGGGMSRVFLAEERDLGRRVVIKVLPPEMAAGVNADRFRREIKLAASLQHPHIVPLLAAGSSGDLLYYIMPFVAGESLRAKLAREGELPIGEAVRLLTDVADALAYAHANGAVHRDIKPENILVSGHHAVITDFGVAKAVSEAAGASSLTSVGVALGTPAYMAPEQAAADPHTDHRADIYALGAVAYELLAGRPPFTSASPRQVLAAHVTEIPPPVTQHRPVVPAPLAELVMRCLAKRPADRWQTAQEVVHQLEAMGTPSGATTPTGMTPVSAPVLTSAERAWGRVALVLGAVVLVLGGGYALFRSLSGHGGAGQSGEKRLAVLPFENLGPADDQYFADGVTEEITERLARVKGLAVISRTSTMQYKTSTKPLRVIGTELGVDYVLEGSIRWEHAPGASEVRVTPQLIRVSDDTHMWADAYNADLTRVFEVQEEIAGKVAEALNVALLGAAEAGEPARPTANLEAYDYYLRGSSLFLNAADGDEYRRATEPLQRAVALDSTFALAWAKLSIAHSGTFWFFTDRSDARVALAKAAADRAFALDSTLPEARMALGYYYYWDHLDYQHALEQFAIAEGRDPNNSQLLQAVAYVERRQGHWADATAHLEHAVSLDPRDYVALRGLAETYNAVRRFPDAARSADRAIAVRPDLVQGYGIKAFAALSEGDTAEVRRTIEDAVQISSAGKVAFTLGAEGCPLWLFPLLDPGVRQSLEQLPLTSDISDTATYYFTKGDLFRFEGQGGLARANVESALVVIRRRMRGRPDDSQYHQGVALALARLGRNDEAVREGLHAVQLLPLAKDAFAGGDAVFNLARIYAIVGDDDNALAELEPVLTVPSNMSPASVRLDPDFVGLRGNPRFRKLVGSS